MKNIVVLFLVLSTVAFAQSAVRSDADKCERILLTSLRSPNDGVVETTVYYTVLYSISGQRLFITDKIINELDILRSTGRTDRIRKIAGLAFNYLSTDNLDVRLEVKFNYHNPERLFDIVEKALNKNSLIVAEH